MSMGKRSRANPKGLNRSIDQASATKIGGGVELLGSDGSYLMKNPIYSTHQNVGYDVKDWSGVHVTVVPKRNPNNAESEWIKVVANRFYPSHPSRIDDGRPVGRWVQGSIQTFGLNPKAIAAGHSAHHVYDTRNASRMYFQIVETSDDLETAIPWLHMQVWGYVHKSDSQGITISDSGDGGGGKALALAKASASDLLAHEDYTYSNVRGDFSVVRASDTTLELHNLPIPLNAIQIIAVGKKAVGATAYEIQRRGIDLELLFNPWTMVITMSNMTFVATDEIMVWVEGPSKTVDLLNQA